MKTQGSTLAQKVKLFITLGAKCIRQKFEAMMSTIRVGKNPEVFFRNYYKMVFFRSEYMIENLRKMR